MDLSIITVCFSFQGQSSKTVIPTSKFQIPKTKFSYLCDSYSSPPMYLLSEINCGLEADNPPS